MSDKTTYWLIFVILSIPLIIALLSLVVAPEIIFSAPFSPYVMITLFVSVCTWLFIVYLFGEKYGLLKGILFFVATAIPGLGSFICWSYWVAKLKWKTI
jgi:hypothetical protein